MELLYLIILIVSGSVAFLVCLLLPRKFWLRCIGRSARRNEFPAANSLPPEDTQAPASWVHTMAGDELRQPPHAPPAAPTYLPSAPPASSFPTAPHSAPPMVRIPRSLCAELNAGLSPPARVIPFSQLSREPSPCAAGSFKTVWRGTWRLPGAPAADVALLHARAGDLAVLRQELRVHVRLGAHPGTPPRPRALARRGRGSWGRPGGRESGRGRTGREGRKGRREREGEGEEEGRESVL